VHWYAPCRLALGAFGIRCVEGAHVRGLKLLLCDVTVQQHEALLLVCKNHFRSANQGEVPELARGQSRANRTCQRALALIQPASPHLGHAHHTVCRSLEV
jgi:hypothetical protein